MSETKHRLLATCTCALPKTLVLHVGCGCVAVICESPSKYESKVCLHHRHWLGDEWQRDPFQVVVKAVFPPLPMPLFLYLGGADVISLLRSILTPFPLGLRLNKLEAIVWSKHKIHLLKLSLEQGYRDSLQFLQAVPGIILKFQHKKPFRCLVQLDTGKSLYI